MNGAAIFRQPAEWERHAACWLAWPSAGDLWGDYLQPAQAAFVQLCRAIAGIEPSIGTGAERLEVLVPNEAEELNARSRLGSIARFHRIPFGDIWLRDTAPIFVRDRQKRIVAARFGFNGWGGKYVLPHDDQVSQSIAEACGLRVVSFPWILEGGSIETDGEGTLLTTRQCLLNPNRNGNFSAVQIEGMLKSALGAQTVLWLDRGLQNDHTDGHIDTLARFVAPARVVCMTPSGRDDPNAQVLEGIHRSLKNMRDAVGRKLEVIPIPSPGRIVDGNGEVMPASYTNFYIANTSVIVPTYEQPWDEAAVEAIARLFPDRQTVGISARAILTGGGAFHCITQQQPEEPMG